MVYYLKNYSELLIVHNFPSYHCMVYLSLIGFALFRETCSTTNDVVIVTTAHTWLHRSLIKSLNPRPNNINIKIFGP
jgi:hypothetical protein